MNEDLITLVTPATEFEANLLAIVLRDNDIESHVFAVPIIGVGVPLSGGTIGVPLQIRASDEKRARQILLENKRHSIDIDWEELELQGTKEPFHGRGMPLIFKIVAAVFLLSMFASLIASLLNLAFDF